MRGSLQSVKPSLTRTLLPQGLSDSDTPAVEQPGGGLKQGRVPDTSAGAGAGAKCKTAYDRPDRGEAQPSVFGRLRCAVSFGTAFLEPELAVCRGRNVGALGRFFGGLCGSGSCKE